MNIMWKSFKKRFIGDREFYRYVILLALPMIIQNAITSFVSFLDNIMVGQVGYGADVRCGHRQPVDVCL